MQYIETTRYQAGFTMIELTIVIAVASILATLAVPSFNDFISRTRQSSTVSQLVSDLNRARSEAIKRNTRVLLCVRSTNTACGTGTSWQNGWLVCADADSNNACDTGTTDIISIHQALHSSITLTGPNTTVRFHSSGISGNGAATLTVAGTWAGAQTSTINIAATGNISRP